MAHEVKTHIAFDDNTKIDIISSIEIKEVLFGHHVFTIEVPFSQIENKQQHGFFKQSYQKYLGKAVNIFITNEIFTKLVANEYVFRGIITGVSMARTASDAESTILLSGFSPTILLDTGPIKKTFISKSITDIFNTTIKSVSSSFLSNIDIKPRKSVTWKYSVQFNETHFHFLSRLADTTGEWFYYDGKKLCLGDPKGKLVKLGFDKDLIDINLGMQVLPSTVESQYYHYQNDRLVSKDSASITISGLSSLNDFSLKQSGSLFKQKYTTNYPTHQRSEGDLNANLKNEKSRIASSMVEITGTSVFPDIHIGYQVQILGSNRVDRRQDYKDFGTYRITGITHLVRDNMYTNVFTAIPKNNATEFPPINYNLSHTRADSEYAIVKDNKDPKGLGRVKVQASWQKGNDTTPWIRLANQMSGNDYGFYFVPEIGEQVIVGYEMGNPQLPIVLGSAYHGKAKQPEKKNDQNYKKTIRTKGGNEILINDEKGKEVIQIKNPKGANQITLSMDGKGKIVVESKGDIEILAKDTIKMEAQKIILDAKVDVKITAGSKLKTSAANTQIESSMKTKLSSSMLDIDGGGIANIKAGLIKLN